MQERLSAKLSEQGAAVAPSAPSADEDQPSAPPPANDEPSAPPAVVETFKSTECCVCMERKVMLQKSTILIRFIYKNFRYIAKFMSSLLKNFTH